MFFFTKFLVIKYFFFAFVVLLKEAVSHVFLTPTFSRWPSKKRFYGRPTFSVADH